MPMCRRLGVCWQSCALVALGLLSSLGDGLIVPQSTRATIAGGRAGLRMMRRWSDPTMKGSGDASPTQEDRAALLSRLQRERDELLAKKIELEKSLKAKETAPHEVAPSGGSVNAESLAPSAAGAPVVPATSVVSSAAPATDVATAAEAERAALLAEKTALLAERQELEQSLTDEAAKADKFMDSLVAETREGIRGVSIWGSKGRAQVYRTAVANDVKKLTPAFFVRLDARVAALEAARVAALEGPEAASAEGAPAEGLVEGPAADLAALAEGLLLALQTDEPGQAAAVQDALARAKAGLPPLSPAEAASKLLDNATALLDSLPAGAESRDGKKEAFSIFVNGQPAGSGANLTQLLAGLDVGDNALMNNLQSSIPAWASESVRALILESANRKSQSQVQDLMLDQRKLEATPVENTVALFEQSFDKLPKGAVNRLTAEVFKGSAYTVTSVDTNSPIAALVFGNSRSNDTAAIHQEVMARLAAIPDLAAQVDLLYTPYPSEFLQGFTEDSDPLSEDVFGSSNPEHAWVVLPKATTELAPKWGAGPQVFAAASLGATALSCMVCAVGAFALNPTFVARVDAGDAATIAEVVPLFVALLGLNVLHEVGHGVAALKHGTQLSPSFFVPSLQLGSFGAITQFAALPKSRAEVFDVALMGPLFGLVGSVVLLASGLQVTAEAGAITAAAGAGGDAARAAVAAWPVVPVGEFGSSALAYALTSLVDPALLDLDPATQVHVHPWTCAGLAGLLVNALQLLPTGRTDGGRMATAVEGRGKASLMGTAVVGGMLGTVLLGPEAQAVALLYFGTLVVLFQRSQDVPFRDEVTNPGPARTALFYAVLLVALVALFPVPGAGPVHTLGEMPVLGMPGASFPAPTAPIPNPVLGMPPL